MPDRETEQRKLKIAATDGGELTDRLPIERRQGRSPQVVLAPSSTGGREESRLPDLQPGDRLRAMAEVAVTTDAESRDGSVGEPYAYDPVVVATLLLSADPEATNAGDKAIELARERYVCSHALHHVVVKPEGEYPVPPGGVPWEGASHVTVVLDASHRDAKPRQIVIVGQNEPDGSISQNMARINVVRWRGASLKDGVRQRTERRRFDVLPLATEKRDVYSLQLDDLRAGEQFVVRVVLPTDSRHLRVGKDNGFNSLRGRDRTRRKAVFRIERDCDRPLYLKLIATAGTAGYAHKQGEAMKVEPGGALEVRRFPAELLG